MGNKNRSNTYLGGGGGVERTTSLECDVGLGLRMQPAAAEETSSFPCKRAMVMPHFPPFQHQQQLGGAPETSVSGGFLGGDGIVSLGGGSLFCNSTSDHQMVASMSDIYDAAGGGMKAPFTNSQWQELGRQTMICKYLMASNSVPAELLLPFTKNSTHASVPQSDRSGLDLKFSSGSDPEPWRCRRTDGKKWRCSRDVAPDQKYCERHAHKSRPRSRKHVENQSHNNASANYSQQHHLPLPADANLQKPISHSPTLGSATTYDKTRSIEWFMRGGSGTIPVSTCIQQRQQLMQSSSRLGDNNTAHNKNTMSFLQQQYEDKQEAITLNPSYMYTTGSSSNQRPEHYEQQQYCNSFLDPKMATLEGSSLHAQTTQRTRHFIDAWSTADGGGLDEISNKGSLSSSGKFPLSSLTLSMSGGNGIDEENEHVDMGIGMMDSERSNDHEALRSSQWMMSPISWMNSAPGGPLGEALRLGIAGTTAKGASDLPSPHGYSNSSTTSSCSKGSYEDGSHQFNFIG